MDKVWNVQVKAPGGFIKAHDIKGINKLLFQLRRELRKKLTSSERIRVQLAKPKDRR